MELRAILHTIEWWLAWHFTSPFSSSAIPKQDLQGSPLLHLLNHFKHYWSLFHPKRAPNLMASFGSANIGRINPFFSILKFLWAGEDKRPTHWSASLLAGWIEGPLSWLFMSTPLQKHTYKSHPVSPMVPVIRGWWQGGKGKGPEVPFFPFYMFQLIDFHPALLSDPFVYFSRNHTLHNSKLGILAENIIKCLV